MYDARGKLDDRSYVQPAEKGGLLSALVQAEEWLYIEEGEDALKSAYVSRLDTLKAVGTHHLSPPRIHGRVGKNRDEVIYFATSIMTPNHLGRR